MDEAATGFEQRVVVHPYVLFQGLQACVKRSTSGGLRAEPNDLGCDSWVVNGMKVFVHQLFEGCVGVEYV